MQLRLVFIIIMASISALIGNDCGSIVTSRPGASNPTSSIAMGLSQLEVGLNSDFNDNISYPILFRAGILSSTEIQIGYGENLNIGLLYGGVTLINGFENSIIISTTLSKNNDNLIQSDLYLPFSAPTSLPVWGQISGSFPNSKTEKISFSYALAVGDVIGDKIGWFGEIYGTPSVEALSVDGGFTYLINDQMQSDISAGVSIDNSDTKFIEMGFSYRLPE